ncbi:MAG: hypothetical protein RLY86_1557 [Pseudomonadota bacterium]|jgi:pimeloyl-ACP methyl ester carboxylesterase
MGMGIGIGRILLLAGALLLPAGCGSVEPTGRVELEGRPITHALAGQGRPAIVFEAGLGYGMDSWAKVFPETAAISTAFAYDRPGYGGSRTSGERLGDLLDLMPGSEILTAVDMLGPAEPAVTGAQAVERLDRILDAAGVRPPYILVGHSLGGQYVLTYAARFPGKVVGILLLDSRPKGFTDVCRERGLSPCEVPDWLRALSPAHMRGEIDGLAETDAMVPHPAALGEIPVIRLVATEYAVTLSAEFHALWVEMQRAEAAAQPNGRITLVEGSGHDIMTDQPAVVTAALRDLVTAARQGGAHLPGP